MNYNILIYNYNEPYPKQGGMERVTDLLARKLAEIGHQVYLLSAASNRAGASYKAPVPLFFLPEKQKLKCSENQSFVLNFIAEKKINYIIDQSEGGIIGHFGIFSNRNNPLLKSVKLIAVQHSSAKCQIDNLHIIKKNPFSGNPIFGYLFDKMYIPFCKLKAEKLRQYLYRSIGKNYDAIVMLSALFFSEFKYYAPQVDEKKLYAIPNPNTFDQINIPDIKKKEVLFVGRLDNRPKGVDRLLKVWQKVFPFFPDWELTIVGDGPDRLWLENLSRDLELERISFEGFREPKEYYERAQIFCMTSTYEGFGMVLTEAMQHGVVPIAFHSYTSVPDIVTNEIDGYLVEPFDIDKYADRLKELISDEPKRKQFAKYGMTDVEKFSKEIIASKWNSLLKNLDKQ